jgi:RND family efflux transporter MFP subunit
VLALLGAATLSAGLLACAPKTAVPVAVKTEVARSGSIDWKVEFSGVLVPNRTVNIYSKIAGQIKAVAADVGGRVRHGQLLVQIDAKELEAQLQVAEAARAGMADQAEQAKAGIETAQLNLDMAQRAYERTKTLFDTQVVTQSQLDDARDRLQLAQAALESANRQYRTVSGSGLAQAEAQENYIRVQLSNSTITSPIDGIVTNRNVNPGEIAPLSAPLMAIADTSTLKLQGNVPQEAVVRLAAGDKVTVSVDGIPGQGYAGTITQVGPIGAATGQYFPVAVSLKNDGRLLAGMTAKASLSLTSSEGVIVPLAALFAQDGQEFLYVVADGKARKRAVSLGAQSGPEAQVLSGVTAGEEVAVSNVGLLSDGAEVAR